MISIIIRKFIKVPLIAVIVVTLAACSTVNDNASENIPTDSAVAPDVDISSDDGLVPDASVPASDAVDLESTYPVAEVSPENTESLVTKSTQDDDLNVKYQAVESGKVEDCDKIEDVQIKNKCKDDIYFSQALDGNDKSFCEKISSSERKEDCLVKIK